jgi:hypothetical protein
MTCFFVQRGGTLPDKQSVSVEGTLTKRGGSTGQRGGLGNWRARHCVLSGHVLYYLDTARSTQPNGHLHLQGVGVRQADDEVDRPLTLCVFWPEDPQASFYLQAHNAAARDDWLAKLRAASAVTLESLAELGMAELKQRVVACGLVNPSDFTRDRQQLQQLFLTHVASRPADYHNTIATGLAKTVLSRSMAKSSLLSTALGAWILGSRADVC